MAAIVLTVLFVIVPLVALRFGTESRTGFHGRVDWRRLDS